MEKRKNIPELRFSGFNGMWEQRRIKDLAEIKYGKDQKLIECENGKYPILGTGGEMGRTNDFLTDKPSVLIGRKGTIDKPRYMDTPFWTVDTLFYTEVFPNANPKWLFYMFETINWYLYNEASGVPSLSGSTIYKIPVCSPSLPEQQKIASFFTAIDQKISQLKQKKTLLEQYKKGVMQKIFSQEIRFRDDNGQKFPKWEMKRFSQIYSFRVTNSFSRENLNYDSGEVKNIHYGDIHTKYTTLLDISIVDVPYVNLDISIERISDDNYCKPNDLVFADASEDVQDVGKCVELVNLNDERVLAGLHTILARPDNELVANGFGGYLMKSAEVRKQIMKISQGSKVTSISSTRLRDIDLVTPCLEEQSKIAEFLAKLDVKISKIQTQIEKAELWKKGLLQKMFV